MVTFVPDRSKVITPSLRSSESPSALTSMKREHKVTISNNFRTFFIWLNLGLYTISTILKSGSQLF